jgi:hypothetical protein
MDEETEVISISWRETARGVWVGVWTGKGDDERSASLCGQVRVVMREVRLFVDR